MRNTIVEWNNRFIDVADADNEHYLGQVLKKGMDKPDMRFGPVIVPIDECEVVNEGGSI